MNKRIQKKYKAEEQKTTVLIPDFVGEWINEVKTMEKPKSDNLGSMFAMLTLFEINKALKNGKTWYQRLVGKYFLNVLIFVLPPNEDGIVLPAPKKEVFNWYGANVGNEGQLIAEAYLNGYETY